MSRGRNRTVAAAGTNVSETTSEVARAKTTVNAIGRNIFPSTPVSVRIGT